MHHLIQRGKVRSQVINVPEGLPELLSDITREVLRCQPTTECLCQFIIDYLSAVIATRYKAKLAHSIIDRALRIVDEAIADICVCDIPKEKADYMCDAMEECFRRFLAQRRCEKGRTKEIIKFNEFDMLDELVQKCKFTDEELKISKPIIAAAYEKFVNAYMTAKESSEGTDSLYRYFRERETLRNENRLKAESAVKIQSVFRGFLVRKSLFMDKPKDKYNVFDMETEMERAAVKIQQFFRRRLKSLDITEKQDTIEGEEVMDTQDPYTPASNLSLTTRPADIRDDFEETKEINEKQDNHNEDDKNQIEEVGAADETQQNQND